MKPKNNPTTAILIILLTLIVFSCRSQELSLTDYDIRNHILNISYKPSSYTFKTSLFGIPVKEINVKK